MNPKKNKTMKKILILIAAAVLLAACTTRYEYIYQLKYTVGDTEYADSGKVVTPYETDVPIAVVTRTGLEVNSYPDFAIDRRKIVYQGNTPAVITEFTFTLNRYYIHDPLMGDYHSVYCNQLQPTE